MCRRASLLCLSTYRAHVYAASMSRAKTFRLSDAAIDHLRELELITGSTQTSLVEQALAVYRSVFAGAVTLNLPTGEAINTERPTNAEHEVPVAVETENSAQPAPLDINKSAKQPSSTVYLYRTNGRTYTFNFPFATLPKRGSDPCPCGTGRWFSKCHGHDFQTALLAGLTCPPEIGPGTKTVPN